MSILNKKASIIIPTYNRCEQLIHCLNSLLLSTYKNIEIIIVNNNSQDNTKQVIPSIIANHSNVAFIDLKENLLIAGGRNEGIKHATGDYLLFVDDDNIVDSNMIEELVKEMDNYPNIALIGPIMFYYRSPNTIYFYGNTINHITSRTKSYFKNKDISNVIINEKIKTDHISNVFMTRKDIIDKVGLLDTNFGIMYDEPDLAMRIKKLGYDIEVISSAKTYHDVVTPNEKNKNKLRELGIETPERAYQFAKNRNIFVYKYFPWYGKLTYNIIFKRLFAAYYIFNCLKNKRVDIAKAYLKGMKQKVIV